jgi:hypothetical protein
MSAKTSFVDGNSIVVTDKTALPPRCFKTNQPVSEAEYINWDLPYIPEWLTTFMILAPFFLVAVPFGVKKRCRLKAGLSSANRMRYQMRKWIAAAMILLAFAIPAVGIYFQSTEVITLGLVGFIPLFWGAFVILILFSHPLKVIKHKDGQFWIRGGSAEFLKSLNTP